MQKYNRTKNDEPKKISSKIALGFFLMIPRIKPAPNQDVIVEYYSFRTCFRAVLRKYYKLTGKETNPTELMPAPDENKNEFYEVDAELEGKTITVRRVSNAPNHDAPCTNPKRKEPPPPPNSPQILTHKSCLPREKHRAKKQRIKPTVNSDPTGVAVVLELNLTPLPDIDEQDDLDDWTHQDKQRTKKKLIEMLDLKDIKANLGDQAQKPTIKFKNYIKQSFKNWENRKNNAEGNRKITVAFKFPNENFFKDESQDFQRCEKLLKYCEGILDKHGFRRSRGRTIQGSIICTFHVASSSLPRLAELRGEILDDFKNLLDEGKIKCMPTMSTTTPTSTSTKKDDERNRSDVRKHFASRTTYVRIEATYIVAFYIINKLLDLKDWSAPTFCIRSIQAFPIHPHPFTNEDLQRLGDCLPVIKMLIQTLQIFLKADLVPCILALIVEYWAFDAIPPPKGIHERPSLASRLTDHNQAPAVEADAKKIFEAVQEGSLEVVKDIMPKPEHHLRCNTKLVDGKGRTPLHLACEHGQTSIAGHLLDLKATVNALDNNDQTPLLIACRKKNLQIVRLLLDSKANIECSTKEYGRTPLLDACSKGHLPIVQCLVEVRANVKATDHYGDGPLHIAAEMEDLATVKYLVENAKANIKAVNKYEVR
uniref:Uncharacterized protein n=1 Tax=Amorphochlora amoebiformis TaxID=1561963 RepID=A0A6T6VVC2_9EUKA|mmetsp:Transcript_25753/g.40747  ORF Transcript_25753/g.40747 Transcript_25753/m.40747 type:complete len:651 (+) Transcript_25753:1059-3011(+)